MHIIIYPSSVRHYVREIPWRQSSDRGNSCWGDSCSSNFVWYMIYLHNRQTALYRCCLSNITLTLPMPTCRLSWRATGVRWMEDSLIRALTYHYYCYIGQHHHCRSSAEESQNDQCGRLDNKLELSKNHGLLLQIKQDGGRRENQLLDGKCTELFRCQKADGCGSCHMKSTTCERTDRCC